VVALAGLERFLAFCLSLNVCFGFSAGTEGFQDFCLSLNRRSDVRKLIGERAEFVCYVNCVMDRTTLDAALDAAPGERWLMARPDVGGERIALSEQQFTDLITVHLADWLEQACAYVSAGLLSLNAYSSGVCLGATKGQRCVCLANAVCCRDKTQPCQYVVCGSLSGMTAAGAATCLE